MQMKVAQSIIADTAHRKLQTQGSGRDASQLGAADFLRLMTEQLKNQDPLKPLEGNEFLGQLAQFSTVQGIAGIQAAFDRFATAQESDQALQAASLIGHDALIAGNQFSLGDQPMSGFVDAPLPGPIDVQVRDGTGALVRRFTVNAAAAGPVAINWDGITDAGTQAPPGTYAVGVTVRAGSSTYALEPQISSRIESVSFSRGGLILNLAGGGSVPFAAVRRIG